MENITVVSMGLERMYKKKKKIGKTFCVKGNTVGPRALCQVSIQKFLCALTRLLGIEACQRARQSNGV